MKNVLDLNTLESSGGEFEFAAPIQPRRKHQRTDSTILETNLESLEIKQQSIT